MASLWVACHGTKLFCCFGPFSCRGRGLSYYRMYKPYSNLQLQMKRVRWVPSPTHSQNQFLMALFQVNKFQLDSFKLERLCEPRVLQVYFGLKGSLSGLLFWQGPWEAKSRSIPICHISDTRSRGLGWCGGWRRMDRRATEVGGGQASTYPKQTCNTCSHRQHIQVQVQARALALSIPDNTGRQGLLLNHVLLVHSDS